MRNIIVSLILIISCCGCIEKDYHNIENDLLKTEGVIYLYDNDQNPYNAEIRLEKEDSLVLWNIIRSGVQTKDQSDQGLGWFKFHLKNNKIIFVELGQSGIARYDSEVAKIDLSLFKQFIKKHLPDSLQQTLQ
jgi:hypothetical protein